MNCIHCGNENSDNAKFCVHCGKEINSAETPPRPIQQSAETIVNAIANIKHAGIATMTYWTILFTDKAVYFCYLGGNALPGIYGAFSDVILSHKAKVKNQTLQEVLVKSEKHYKFQGDSINTLEYKKVFLGGAVIFPKEGGKTMKLRINGKQFEVFSKNISTLLGK